MSTEWDTRAEAWQARRHQTTIRRSRKGGDNSHTYSYALAPVIGRRTGATRADRDRWAELVPADIRDAIQADLGTTHRLICGTSGLDLAKLVDRYADALGVPTLLGTEGRTVAYKQLIDSEKASPGADLQDLIACTDHHGDLTQWADSPAARHAFKVDYWEPGKLSWPARLTAGTARSRKSESDIAGPRIPRSNGKLSRTGNLYGAEFVRTGKRTVMIDRPISADNYGYVTLPRFTYYRKVYGTAEPIYGTRAGWYKLWPFTCHFTPGVRTVRHHNGTPIIDRDYRHADDPNYDRRERVFIGHRSIVRGPIATPRDVKAPKHLGAFKLTAGTLAHFVSIVLPNTVATVDYGPLEPGYDNTFGTVSRAESGRWSIILHTPTGRVRHQPKGNAAALEYLTRYL